MQQREDGNISVCARSKVANGDSRLAVIAKSRNVTNCARTQKLEIREIEIRKSSDRKGEGSCNTESGTKCRKSNVVEIR